MKATTTNGLVALYIYLYKSILNHLYYYYYYYSKISFLFIFIININIEIRGRSIQFNSIRSIDQIQFKFVKWLSNIHIYKYTIDIFFCIKI